jgi:HAD superfamily hydrolase (TIGR01509 family)
MILSAGQRELFFYVHNLRSCVIMMQMSNFKNIKVIIFDMDGLLLDSESVAMTAFVESCRECGFEPDLKIYYKCIGTNSNERREILTRGYGQYFPYDAVSILWQKKLLEEILLKPIPLKVGVSPILEYLEANDIRKAVVTSTRYESAVRMLSNAGLADYFEFVLGGDQITKGKPDPEIYLTGCKRLGEQPADCLALEDSDNGVLAASSAGMEIIQVPDLIEPSEKVKALGHRIVKSLLEVKELLKQRDKF